MNKFLRMFVHSRFVFMLWIGINAILLENLRAGSFDDIIDITEINPKIVVDMKYATNENITHKALYSMNKCFLRKSTALKLDTAQKNLEKIGKGLKVWDCYRPLSIQKKLWVLIRDGRFVANPRKGSRHNRATSVDVTLIDSIGKELPMPTKFDDFSIKASRHSKSRAEDVIQNTRLLEDNMINAGFEPLETEWWHFDDKDWKQYKLLDISFDKL